MTWPDVNSILLFGVAAGAVWALVVCIENLHASYVETAIDRDPEVMALRAHLLLLADAERSLTPIADILHGELVALSGHEAEIKHGLALVAAFEGACAAGSEGQRRSERVLLSHVAVILRDMGAVADLKDREAQRPLRVQAQEATWRKRADSRWIEAILNEQALHELRHGPKPESELDSTATIRHSLLAAIENAKADGKDSGDLERALRALTDTQS